MSIRELTKRAFGIRRTECVAAGILATGLLLLSGAARAQVMAAPTPPLSHALLPSGYYYSAMILRRPGSYQERVAFALGKYGGAVVGAMWDTATPSNHKAARFDGPHSLHPYPLTDPNPYMTSIACATTGGAKHALAAPLPVTLPALPVAHAVQTAPTTFNGIYTATTEEEPALLTLTQDSSGTVTGTLKTGGEAGALKGRVENGRLTGTMTYGSNTLAFVITREKEKETLRLRLGDEELNFTAQASATPKSAPVSKPTGTSAQTVGEVKPAPAPSVPAGWKEYRNPIGLAFRYPASWNMTDVNGLLLLAPPGVEVPAGGMPSEIYSVVGLPVPGINRVDDPRLLQMADGMVAQMFPYMRRSGNGETARLSGVGGSSGLIVTYDGSNPTTGKPSRIRSYAVVHKELLLQIQAWGDRDKVAARDGVLRQMYGSLTSGPSEHDPRIVGNWAGGESSSDRVKKDGDGSLRSSVASQGSAYYRLMPDGALQSLTISRSSVTIRSSKSIPESQRVDANIDTGDQQQWKKGRWYAGNGKIVVLMEDGTGMSADYQIVGNALVVRFAGGATVRFTRF